ncbi:MAG: SMI1/KNR4 family protein, partial [Campylobacter sp.]|nr:SMI1/KNR4 family protein [Campylobacter sp.]
LVQNLMIAFELKEYRFSPKCVFDGEICIDGIDAIKFYLQNPNEHIKIFDGDDTGAIVRGDMKYWFSKDGHKIHAIQIGELCDDEREYIAKNRIDENTVPNISTKFAYLVPLWQEWVASVDKIVPRENRYYNLIRGVSAKKAQSLRLGNAKIPSELAGFYMIFNVSYNAVTSAFSFGIAGREYALIAFDDIKREWESVGELIDEFSSEQTSKKPEFNGYASPKWIPLAHDYEGNYLLYDAEFGQIIELDNESWSRRVVANSLSELLKNEINSLKSGNLKRFEFILKE